MKGTSMSRFGQSLCATLLLFGLASPGCAMNQNMKEDVVAIQGVVRVVGNEPFTQVVVTVREKANKDVDWLIIGPLAQDLRQGYQMRTIIIEGTVCKPTMPDFSKCLKPSRIVNPGK
jgi:hypothetical protein